MTCVTAVGCGKRIVELGFASSKYLNLDDSGAALSVVVRIYQLKAKEGIEKADFFSLWKSDKDLLGEDLISRKEITLHPETRMIVEVVPEPEAEYLAVVALFRRPQGNSWRKLIPLKEGKVRQVRVTVHERSVKMVKIK